MRQGFARHRTGQHVAANDDAIDAGVTHVLEHRLECRQIAVDVVEGRDARRRHGDTVTRNYCGGEVAESPRKARMRATFGLELACKRAIARRLGVDVADLGVERHRPSPTGCPSRSRDRARAAAARSIRAGASPPACRPRSDRAIPRAARSGGDPRRSDRTARAGGRRPVRRAASRARPPASTSRSPSTRACASRDACAQQRALQSRSHCGTA